MQAKQNQNGYGYYFPPEILENIVRYFDGRTLLNFKLTSKSCNAVAKNVCKRQKLWKKICLKEIPWLHLTELFTKLFDVYTPFDSLPEPQYEGLYKHWLQWQSSTLKFTYLNGINFAVNDGIRKIIAHRLDIMIMFPKHTKLITLKKDMKTNTYVPKLTDQSSIHPHSDIMTINPVYQSITGDPCFPDYKFYRSLGSNICPLHNKYVAHTNCFEGRRPLLAVDSNFYNTKCCWVRDSWYGCYKTYSPLIFQHFCYKLNNILFLSVTQGVIISSLLHNSISFHNIYHELCVTSHSWLNTKYMQATSAYIYTDILIVGTQNGFVLAYRLLCWDDLISLKEERKLLEFKTNIGQIIRLDVVNYENLKAIVAASNHKVIWIKIS